MNKNQKTPQTTMAPNFLFEKYGFSVIENDKSTDLEKIFIYGPIFQTMLRKGSVYYVEHCSKKLNLSIEDIDFMLRGKEKNNAEKIHDLCFKRGGLLEFLASHPSELSDEERQIVIDCCVYNAEVFAVLSGKARFTEEEKTKLASRAKWEVADNLSTLYERYAKEALKSILAVFYEDSERFLGINMWWMKKSKKAWTKTAMLRVLELMGVDEEKIALLSKRGVDSLKDNVLKNIEWKKDAKWEYYACAVDVEKIKNMSLEEIESLRAKKRGQLVQHDYNFLPRLGTITYWKNEKMENVLIERNGNFFQVINDKGDVILRKSVFSSYVNVFFDGKLYEPEHEKKAGKRYLVIGYLSDGCYGVVYVGKSKEEAKKYTDGSVLGICSVFYGKTNIPDGETFDGILDVLTEDDFDRLVEIWNPLADSFY